MAQVPQISEYLRKLKVDNPDVATRYQQKIARINNVDPFSLTDDDVSYKASDFPRVANMDIVSYLVLTTSYYTKQQMKAFKSLQAFKYFEAGFVHKCGAVKINNYTVIVGRVKHSQRMNEQPLQVWVMCQDDGSVETAHCTCMAGAGEVCSHVGAVLYALEHVQTTKEQTSCTDVEASWNVPRVAKVTYQPVRSMDFGHTISGHKLTTTIPPITSQELEDMFREIEEAGSSSVLMRVVEPFASEMEVVEESFSNIFKELHCSECDSMGYDELLQRAEQCSDFTLNADDCERIQTATSSQAQSSLWFHQRAGRITASNFKRACRTSLDAPSLSLIKTICYPTNFMFKTKATIWGTTHEKDALAAYKLYSDPSHEGLQLEQVGLCLSPQYPSFGASPDAMVTCECCGHGCVEVKCPYLLKSMSIEQFLEERSCCLTNSMAGEPSLDTGHAYYYQVQMQMAILGVQFCDFVIWSPTELYVERVVFNEDFWWSESSKALEFHKKIIMPELLGRFFTRDDATIETWCICQGIDDGRAMLCCDDDNCNIKWHHLECVGLLDVPEQTWLCDACEQKL